jgi:hypothetical protein
MMAPRVAKKTIKAHKVAKSPKPRKVATPGKKSNRWMRLAQEYASYALEQNWPLRDEDSLKNKFKALKNSPKPTGDPDCPWDVMTAKRLQREINASRNVVGFDEDDEDEEDEGEEAEEEKQEDDDEEFTSISKHHRPVATIRAALGSDLGESSCKIAFFCASLSSLLSAVFRIPFI